MAVCSRGGGITRHPVTFLRSGLSLASAACKPTRQGDPDAIRGRRVIVLLAAIVVLSIADLVITMTHLTTTGMMEANPVAVFLIRTTDSPWSIMVLKLVTVGTTVAVLFRLRRRVQAEIGSWLALGILVSVAFFWHAYSQSFNDLQAVALARQGGYGDAWMTLSWSR